jgi:hypothetical protein
MDSPRSHEPKNGPTTAAEVHSRLTQLLLSDEAIVGPSAHYFYLNDPLLGRIKVSNYFDFVDLLEATTQPREGVEVGTFLKAGKSIINVGPADPGSEIPSYFIFRPALVDQVNMIGDFESLQVDPASEQMVIVEGQGSSARVVNPEEAPAVQALMNK